MRSSGIADAAPGVFDRIGVRALGCLGPETARSIGLALMRRGIGAPKVPGYEPAPRVRLWNRDFAGGVGIAAGLDKDGEVFDTLFRWGAGFVEVGTVTPRYQYGNHGRRLFRLPSDKALINRLGFNSAGMEAVATRLAARDRTNGLVGVNIGANRDGDPMTDYAAAFDRLAPLADYVAVNVSSPNTPGLRGLQVRDRLAALVDLLHERRAAAGLDCPVLVKVAPDLETPAVRDIAGLSLAAPFDGLIIGNTTVARPSGLRDPRSGKSGGLSGRPLFAPSTALLRDFHRLTEGRVPLVGVGGVASADDAYAKIRAGASLVQLYTALTYSGLGLLGEITRGLAARLAEDGFATVSEAVGADAACDSPAP